MEPHMGCDAGRIRDFGTLVKKMEPRTLQARCGADERIIDCLLDLADGGVNQSLPRNRGADGDRGGAEALHRASAPESELPSSRR